MKAKKKLSLKVMCIVSCLILLTVTGCSSAPEGYLEYKNEGSEFYIVYPEDWEKRSYDGSVINFFSPPETVSDGFFENISVVTIPLIGYDFNNDGLSDVISLEQYIAMSKADIVSYIEDYTEISNTDIMIGSLKGKRLEYTGSVKDIEEEETSETEEPSETEESKETAGTPQPESKTYRWLQAIAINDEVAYIITYTSLIDSNEEFIEIFDTMISHCKIG